MGPKDPMILFSYINTKLRDEYGMLEQLCEDLELDRRDLEERLFALGYAYDPAQNRFL